jgi:hypothetical protein
MGAKTNKIMIWKDGQIDARVQDKLPQSLMTLVALSYFTL